MLKVILGHVLQAGSSPAFEQFQVKSLKIRYLV